MLRLACLASLMLVTTAPLAGSSIVGSWIAHQDNRQDPDLIPTSICATFEADGTFSIRFRLKAEVGEVSGLYELKGDQLQLKKRGRASDVSRVIVERDRLRLFIVDEDPDEDSGLVLERTPWCE